MPKTEQGRTATVATCDAGITIQTWEGWDPLKMPVSPSHIATLCSDSLQKAHCLVATMPSLVTQSALHF